MAGFDITFTPPRTISTMWAIAERPLAATIRSVHDAAVNDATVLYAAKVTLSEAYTASLVGRLRDLGLVMVPTGRADKRPVYEIAGVDPDLTKRWSTRRGQVVGRTGELVTEFEAEYGRLPTAEERLELAQRATPASGHCPPMGADSPG